MARMTKPLTATEIKTVKSKDKDYKLFDGGGLYLLVKKTGGKLWRFKYRFEGKEKVIAIGRYPDVSLADTRKKREKHKVDVAIGIDVYQYYLGERGYSLLNYIWPPSKSEGCFGFEQVIAFCCCGSCR